ncbi:MAG TPA: VWA domain-containing protein, partial [Planctomycetota bacterium]|nr:VWA domain-containing protein [Planctomycetota bacterium]
DEVRDIDWNVTARAGIPFVKLYREERELTVLIAVDVSYSGVFGTTGQEKNELAAELAALIAFSAIRNNDNVGLILFSREVELYLPPKKGKKHVLRVIRELLGHRPESRGTSLAEALRFIGRIQRRRATVFLISDFLDEGFEKALAATRAKHDVVAVRTSDRRERELPDVGLITFEDPETGEIGIVDTRSRRVREKFHARALEADRKLAELLRFLEIDHLEIRTGESYIEKLRSFFREREKKRYR